MIKLSQRLEMIAGQVPAGSRLADIGSDHALLPVYLLQQGVIGYAVAGELNDGPLQAAQRQIRDAGAGALIEARKGDGLVVISPGEVDAVTIAGMGGSLIVRILDDGGSRLDGVKRLVLQPNVAEEQVRRWLAGNGWLLTREQCLEEDDKIYVILTADRAAQAPTQALAQGAEGARGSAAGDGLYAPVTLGSGLAVPEDWVYRFGPYLLQQPGEAFFRKWMQEARKLEEVCRQLAQSSAEPSRVKQEELQRDILFIGEVLACLQKDRR